MIIFIKGGYKAVCGQCGRVIDDYADTRNQAKEIAAKYGWERGKDGEYYCPKCAFFMEASSDTNA